MADTLVYVDSSSFKSSSASVLVEGLRSLFGHNSVIKIFRNVSDNGDAKIWTDKIVDLGLKPVLVQPSLISKPNIDHVLFNELFTDLLPRTKHKRKQLTIVMVLGWSDFNPVIDTLRSVVKQTIVCSNQDAHLRYPTTARFISFEMLTGNHVTESFTEAKNFLISVLEELQCDQSIDVSELHDYLVQKESDYWPMRYGCRSTSQLLEILGISIASPLFVGFLLHRVRTASPPIKAAKKVTAAVRSPSPRARSTSRPNSRNTSPKPKQLKFGHPTNENVVRCSSAEAQPLRRSGTPPRVQTPPLNITPPISPLSSPRGYSSPVSKTSTSSSFVPTQANNPYAPRRL
ncbi:hypothetical protein GEMRC1_010361 [Eukaryota sp. GEM-RC1]